MNTITSELLPSGFLDALQSTMTAVRKPLTESPSDDASMLIETVSGKKINVTRPMANDILIEDIAWALSRIPRFAGHSITEIPYNVAQHSVYVSELLEELLRASPNFSIDEELRACVAEVVAIGDHSKLLLKALFHDGHEAYTGDIPSPIKRIPELKQTIALIEGRLDHAIFSKLGLDELSESERKLVTFCDKLAQSIEAYQYMPSRGKDWNLPSPTLVRLQKFPGPKTAIQSYEDFLSHYKYLSEQ